MLGTLNRQIREVTVVGGGVSGLLIAYYLDRAGYLVTLKEASNRLGGLIETETTPWGISECAAHSLLVTPQVRQLCDDLNVKLVPIRPESRARYVFRDGKMKTFPLTLWEVIRAFLRAYFVWAPRNLNPQNLTMEQWGNRFFGSPITRYLLTPFLRGIYGARPSEVSVGAAFPSLVVPKGHSFLSDRFARWIRGRLKRKPKSEMMAPLGGMASLIQGLEMRLKERLGDRLMLNTPVRELPQRGNVILAVPAPIAGEMLFAQDPTLSQRLKEVTYTSLVSATAFVEKTGFSLASKRGGGGIPRGVGVLMPEDEGAETLGILFNSSSFTGRVSLEPDSSWVSMTAFLGGSQSREILKFSDDVIQKMILKDLVHLFGFRGEISGIRIHRWVDAIPCYNHLLLDLWATARANWCSQPGHLLCGNYTGQVSIRGMVEESALAAELHSCLS